MVTSHSPAIVTMTMPLYFPPPTLFSLPSVRISGCFVFGSAGINNSSPISASVTGCPFASLSVTSKRFWPRPNGDGVVVSVSVARRAWAAADTASASMAATTTRRRIDSMISFLMAGEKCLEGDLIGAGERHAGAIPQLAGARLEPRPHHLGFEGHYAIGHRQRDFDEAVRLHR